jgi:uncharacterized protein YjbJ (UPF0337 family)
MCSIADHDHVCDTGNDNYHLHAGLQYNRLERAAWLSTKLPADLCGTSHHHYRVSYPIRTFLGIFITLVSREIINKRSNDDMDKDRIAGSVKEAKGAIKETVGKVLGDVKLQADGKSDKAEGKAQNALGGLKDALNK